MMSNEDRLPWFRKAIRKPHVYAQRSTGLRVVAPARVDRLAGKECIESEV
jgi:hypothetical protein